MRKPAPNARSFEVLFLGNQGFRRRSQIGGAPEEPWNLGRNRILHFAAGFAAGKSLWVWRESWDISIPTIRQVATLHQLPIARLRRKCFLVGVKFFVPLAFPFCAAINGPAHVFLSFWRDQELRVRRPAVADLGEPNLIFAQRLAVGLLGVMLVRRSPCDVAINDDERGTTLLFLG